MNYDLGDDITAAARIAQRLMRRLEARDPTWEEAVERSQPIFALTLVFGPDCTRLELGVREPNGKTRVVEQMDFHRDVVRH